MPNWPGTNDAPCRMVSARSALAVATSETTSVAVSLAAFGSGTEPVTVAESVTVGPAAGSTATVRVMVDDAPAIIAVAFVQVTVWPAAAQLQPTPAPETRLRPAGSVSVTVVGPGVAVGPLLPTTMLKVPVPPAVNAPGCESAIAMSALGAVGAGGAIAARGLNGATHTRPRPARAPAVGSSKMKRSPVSGFTVMPEAKWKPVVPPGTRFESNGRLQVRAHQTVAFALPAAGTLPSVT